MSDNFIDDNDVVDLVEACLPMENSQVLDLSNNPGIAKITALKRLVQRGVQIREININGDRVAPTEQRKLQCSTNVSRLCAQRSFRSLLFITRLCSPPVCYFSWGTVVSACRWSVYKAVSLVRARSSQRLPLSGTACEGV